MHAYRCSVVALFALISAACATNHAAPESEDGGASPDTGRTVGSQDDECGNGMDDDGDGLIDEGCPCGAGETQSCFTGDYPFRSVGACADGLQHCVVEGSVEWGTWGACEGDAPPGPEVCEGALDEDCDGAIDNDCPCTAGETRECGMEFVVEPCMGGTQTCQPDGTFSGCEGAVGPVAESCGSDGLGDGIDNDCDGETDEPCGCLPQPEICGDGVDDDCDGEIDEPGCLTPTTGDGGMGACYPVPELCADSLDNNCDGLVDEAACDPGPRCTPPSRGPSIDDACGERHTGIVDLVGNQQTFCARHRDGRVYCWGSNLQGALGVGDEWLDYSSTPREVIHDTLAIDLGGGTANCVLRADGIMCWGRQPLGGGGPGSYHDVALSPFAPPQAESVTDIVEIVVGSDHHLMRTADGSVWGWGYDAGQLGDGLVGSTYAPEAVRAIIDDVVDLDSQLRTVCAVRSDGTVWCWGSSRYGQAGPPGGLGVRAYEPNQIPGVEDALSVAAGTYHACALLCSGEVACWGRNGLRGDGAEAGDGFTTAAAVIPGLSGVYRIEAGAYGTCAFRGDGELWCWGMQNFVGAPDYERPRRVPEIGPVVDIALGELAGEVRVGTRSVYKGAICVLEACGGVRCWGKNDTGQVGDGTTMERRSPVDVIGLP